jgi:ABC-type nickel/cobalt efflux system permease component RcnA
MGSALMERHLIAYAIVLLVLIGALLLWRRSRRVRRAPEPHLKIDLLAEAEVPLRRKP